MIEIFRNLANSIAAKLLLGLLVASFAAWGIGDVLRGTSSSTVAEVGGRGLSVNDFRRAFYEKLRQFGADMDMQRARTLQVDQMVLREMVDRAVLWEEAQDLGLDAPDYAIIGRLQTIPAFQNPGGAFSRDIYELWLEREGWRKRDFEADLREDIARELLVSGVAPGGKLARIAAETVWKRRNEKRDLDYVSLDLSAVAEPDAPTEAEIAAFHQEQAAQFTAPERREIAFLWIRAADRADLSSVTEAQARALYDERIDTYRKPERRNLEQVVFDDKAAAEAAAQRLANGESFAKVAADAGYGPNDAALGYVSKADLEPFDKALADAAFGLKIEGAVGPIETTGGWTLLNIAGLSPAAETTFEDARPALTEEIAANAARRELPTVANAVEDLRAAGAGLEEAAQKERVTFGVVTVDRNGLDQNGEPVEGLPPDIQLLTQAFETEPGEEKDLTDLPDGEYYVYAVRSVTPAALKPLETVRDEVIDSWTQSKRMAALEARAAELLARLKAGETPEAIAQELGVEVKRAEGLTRAAPHPDLPADLVADVFGVEAGAAVGAAFESPADGGRKRLLARVETVTPADPKDGATEIDTMLQAVDRGVSLDILQLYAGAAIESHGVDINPAAVEFALSTGARY